nr:phosphatidylinositol 4-phosphate 3-kinase C2 domain-containing subunit beta-like isoform X2 [Paramormyrops kingsleyae]
MSAAQMQSDGDQHWGCLESLGLSPRELVMAEALQMEYDALSRLKQEGKVPSTRSAPEPGSDPMLHLQPGVSSPLSTTLQPRNYSKEPLYILDSPAKNEYESSHILSPKNITPSDDPPPVVPPRNPLSSSNSQVWSGSVPRDVNLFSPEVELHKVSSGEPLNYEDLNEALTRLNEVSPPAPGRWGNGDTAGKPVTRSKTLPPKVPPRTYLPLRKSSKNQRRVSADPVTIGSRLNGFGYELFQVYEERDEEVAAFCHMLDVLRLDYPSSDRSKNTGFVWSPCVAQDELQQGLGVSVKVTVISDHFREPLIFTCDGKCGKYGGSKNKSCHKIIFPFASTLQHAMIAQCSSTKTKCRH